MTKYPPKIKIYEALSTIASNKIKMNLNDAEITSSNNEKKYTVKWKENIYSSNDNASIWQGYPGYPIIATILYKGKINYSKEILPSFKDINWHELNKEYKRDYNKVINIFLSTVNEETKKKIEDEVESIYNQLINLNIEIKRKI